MLRYKKYVELNTAPEFTGEPTEYGTVAKSHTFVPSISTYPTPNVEQIYNNNQNNNNNNEIIFIGVFSTVSAFVIIVLIFFCKKNCPKKNKKNDTIEYEFGTQWTHDNV